MSIFRATRYPESFSICSVQVLFISNSCCDAMPFWNICGLKNIRLVRNCSVLPYSRFDTSVTHFWIFPVSVFFFLIWMGIDVKRNGCDQPVRQCRFPFPVSHFSHINHPVTKHFLLEFLWSSTCEGPWCPRSAQNPEIWELLKKSCLCWSKGTATTVTTTTKKEISCQSWETKAVY